MSYARYRWSIILWPVLTASAAFAAGDPDSFQEGACARLLRQHVNPVAIDINLSYGIYWNGQEITAAQFYEYLDIET